MKEDEDELIKKKLIEALKKKKFPRMMNKQYMDGSYVLVVDKDFRVKPFEYAVDELDDKIFSLEELSVSDLGLLLDDKHTITNLKEIKEYGEDDWVDFSGLNI